MIYVLKKSNIDGSDYMYVDAQIPNVDAQIMGKQITRKWTLIEYVCGSPAMVVQKISRLMLVENPTISNRTRL